MKLFSLCLSFFLLLILNIYCTKEKLPKASEKGANTFGCKIEGRLFLPQQSPNFGSMLPLITYYSDSSSYFALNVSENHDNSDNMLQHFFHLEVQNLKIGTNTLNEINTGEVYISEFNKPDQSFTTTQAVGGILNITRLDTSAKIISGTFSFHAAIQPTNTPGKIISVTDGRFDVKYK